MYFRIINRQRTSPVVTHTSNGTCQQRGWELPAQHLGLTLRLGVLQLIRQHHRHHYYYIVIIIVMLLFFNGEEELWAWAAQTIYGLLTCLRPCSMSRVLLQWSRNFHGIGPRRKKRSRRRRRRKIIMRSFLHHFSFRAQGPLHETSKKKKKKSSTAKSRVVFFHVWSG